MRPRLAHQEPRRAIPQVAPPICITWEPGRAHKETRLNCSDAYIAKSEETMSVWVTSNRMGRVQEPKHED